MSSEVFHQDTETRPDLQALPNTTALRPFPDVDGVRGGMSLLADGPMSWNGHSSEVIAQNRLRYFAQMGIDPALVVTAEQVHGANVFRVTRTEFGRGAIDRESRILKTDGLITAEHGAVLAVLHADCAPVFYADIEHRAVGIAHAGRRGILAGIAGHMLRTMAKEFGSNPHSMRVSIGPTVSTHNYSVDRPVADEFAARFGDQVVVQESDKIYLDLFAALTVDLLETGLNPSFIPTRPLCTVASPGFSSYRRDGAPVRSMLSWLSLT